MPQGLRRAEGRGSEAAGVVIEANPDRALNLNRCISHFFIFQDAGGVVYPACTQMLRTHRGTPLRFVSTHMNRFRTVAIHSGQTPLLYDRNEFEVLIPQPSKASEDSAHKLAGLGRSGE